MADLELKLDQTMEELKKLKEQLALEESSKRVAEKKQENGMKVVVFSNPQTSVSTPNELEEKNENLLPVEIDGESCITTDVCNVEFSCCEEDEGQIESKMVVGESVECLEKADMEAKLVKREETVKKEAEEAMANLSEERKKNEEIEVKLAGAEEELRQSRAMIEQMKQKLEAQEAEKASMEAEMKCLRVQTDQWRKASEAAASMLGNETSSDGWSTLPAGAGADEGPADQKRRGSGGGIRVLGELWKKRGQLK